MAAVKEKRLVLQHRLQEIDRVIVILRRNRGLRAGVLLLAVLPKLLLGDQLHAA